MTDDPNAPKSKAQSAFFKSLYGKPHEAKKKGVDYAVVKAFVEADNKSGTKHLPERSGAKTARSKRRK